MSKKNEKSTGNGGNGSSSGSKKQGGFWDRFFDRAPKGTRMLADLTGSANNVSQIICRHSKSAGKKGAV